MNIKQPEVTITVRPGIDLSNLTKDDGPLFPCGVIGISIAKAVLKGEGKAKIPMKDLKSAITTQYELEIILDNFELKDPKSGRPIFWWLIDAYLKSKK